MREIERERERESMEDDWRLFGSENELVGWVFFFEISQKCVIYSHIWLKVYSFLGREYNKIKMKCVRKEDTVMQRKQNNSGSIISPIDIRLNRL